jgi:L-malate glycosyltransferase
VPGGTENQMIELARRLDPSRFETHVVSFHRSGPWLERAEAGAAAVAEFPIRGLLRPGTLARMWAFARWCRRHRIAVLHATDIYANIFALPAAWCAGVPVRIANRREINPGKRGAMIALQRASYAFATRVAANSRAAAARLVKERVPASKVEVVGNGLDLSRFQPRAPHGGPRIITVANLRPEKAHGVLLAAARTVVDRHADAEFWIVGDGVLRTEVRALASRLGLGDRVRFFGHRDDVPELLAQCDIFALPSRSEAMPNGVLEAMAAGLAVVATRVGGIPEVISHGRTGILVPPDQPQALAAALIDLIEQPSRAAALGREARQFVHDRYSFERMVGAFERLYLSALPRAASSTAAAQLELS